MKVFTAVYWSSASSVPLAMLQHIVRAESDCESPVADGGGCEGGGDDGGNGGKGGDGDVDFVCDFVGGLIGVEVGVVLWFYE